LFGDLTKSSTFGDRRQTTISVSDQVYWANDQVGIKGTERFDIVNHDIGTATVAGPVVALQGLNS
jgi:HK97 family phage major capsid protein